MSIHLIQIILFIHNLPDRSINFAIAISQADLDDLGYMKIHAGINVHGIKSDQYVFVLKNCLYGLRKVPHNWF